MTQLFYVTRFLKNTLEIGEMAAWLRVLVQASGPEFRSTQRRSWVQLCMHVSPVLWDKDRKIPRAHEPVSLGTEGMVRFSEWLCLKAIRQRTEEGTPNSALAPVFKHHVHVHILMGMNQNIHHTLIYMLHTYTTHSQHTYTHTTNEKRKKKCYSAF